MVTQSRESIHPLWYLGTGKAEELKQAKAETHFTMLVADDELSPKQQRSLENSPRRQGARPQRHHPRHLRAAGAHARGPHPGGVGAARVPVAAAHPHVDPPFAHGRRHRHARGPGETQLETDRRVIRERIKKTRERVEEVRGRRETAARARERRLLPTMAIVGYTNAGKSTLLNALVGEEAAVVEDMLFATLDPTTRRVRLREGQTVIVSDTVGFIHKLPHQLVEAFQATLEEVTRADVLLEVVDLADRHAAEHRRTVQTVLDELGAGHKPRVVVLNKADRVDAGVRRRWRSRRGWSAETTSTSSRVSALTGMGIDGLRKLMGEVLAELWLEVDVVLPYSAGDLLARVRERGTVEFEYRDEDVRVGGKVPPSLAGELQRGAVSWERLVRARHRAERAGSVDTGGGDMTDELLTAGKIAEKLGVSAGKVSKTIKEHGLEPDQKKGNCGYFGPEKVKRIEEALKAK